MLDPAGWNIVLCLLGIFMRCSAQDSCLKDEATAIANDPTRTCRKSCTTTADCDGEKKTCSCDDDCGYSCFNRDALCPVPEAPVDGTVSVRNDDYKYGAIAKYKCNDGYFMTGTELRKCRSTKDWSHSKPNCTRGCPPPSNLGNGFAYTDSDGYVPGTIVTYQCKTGYTSVGGNDFDVTCQADFTWSPANFVCGKKNCGYPGEPTDGELRGTDFLFGATVRFVCDTGHTLNGDDERRCNADATWTGSVPTCDPVICPAPDVPQNGAVDDRYAEDRQYSQEIDYSCNIGFKLIGPERGRCNENATWGAVPKCVVDPDCDFRTEAKPTCGYSVVSGSFARIYENNGDGGVPSHVLAGDGTLRSATITIPSDVDGACVKLDHRHNNAGSLTGDVKIANGPFQEVWSAPPAAEKWAKGEIPVRRPSGVTGELQLQWQIRATSDVQIDNIVSRPISECAPPPETQPQTTTASTTTTMATVPAATTGAVVPRTERPAESPTTLATASEAGGEGQQTAEPGDREGETKKSTTPPSGSTQGPRPPSSAPNTTVIIVVVIVVVFILIALAVVGLCIYKNHMDSKKIEGRPVEGESPESAGKLVGGTNV